MDCELALYCTVYYNDLLSLLLRFRNPASGDGGETMGLGRNGLRGAVFGVAEPDYLIHGQLDTSLLFTITPSDQLYVELYLGLYKIAGMDVVCAPLAKSAVWFFYLDVQAIGYDPFILDVSDFPEWILYIGNGYSALSHLNVAGELYVIR